MDPDQSFEKKNDPVCLGQAKIADPDSAFEENTDKKLIKLSIFIGSGLVDPDPDVQHGNIPQYAIYWSVHGCRSGSNFREKKIRI